MDVVVVIKNYYLLYYFKTLVMLRVSIAVMKHHGPNASGEERVYSTSTSTLSSSS